MKPDFQHQSQDSRQSPAEQLWRATQEREQAEALEFSILLNPPKPETD